MNTNEFNENQGTVKDLTEILQQRTGNEPKEVVWKILKVIVGIETQNDTQIKFKEESLNKIEDLFPDFLLGYKKDFSKSKLTTILSDLDNNVKSIDDDKNFELHNYINQVKDRVMKIKGKDTHKTVVEIENEILKEMEYNFTVVHGKNEFLNLEKDSTELIENIKNKYKRIHENNVLTIWDTIVIGRLSVELNNLEILHGSYVSAKMNQEFDSEFTNKYNFSKTTQSKYIKQVLAKDCITSYSKSNGKNKVELKVHSYIASIKSEKCLEKTKNLTQTKLSNMRELDAIADFKIVLNGDDKPYTALKEKQKAIMDGEKNDEYKEMVDSEYISIESSLKNEINRLGINPPTFTKKDYEIMREKNHKDLVFEFFKDFYSLYKEKEYLKSKLDSQGS